MECPGLVGIWNSCPSAAPGPALLPQVDVDLAAGLIVFALFFAIAIFLVLVTLLVAGLRR